MVPSNTQVRVDQDQLHDFVSAPVIQLATEWASDGNWAVGSELIFNLWPANKHSESDELPAATVNANICYADLPPYSGHRPVEIGDPNHMVQHVEISQTERPMFGLGSFGVNENQAGRPRSAMASRATFCGGEGNDKIVGEVGGDPGES